MNIAALGKMLILVGAATLILGLIVLFADRIPFLGRLPGDIVIKRRNFSLYFPVATSLLLSLVLTVVLIVINHLKR